MLYLDLRGSQHQQINAYLCYLHFFLYKSNLHINKNDFKSLTISYIYFEFFFVSYKFVYFLKLYSMLKTFNIIWNNHVMKH